MEKILLVLNSIDSLKVISERALIILADINERLRNLTKGQ
jgi:hypothetical protein